MIYFFMFPLNIIDGKMKKKFIFHLNNLGENDFFFIFSLFYLIFYVFCLYINVKRM